MDRPTNKELIERLREYNLQSCGLTRLKDVNYSVWVKNQNQNMRKRIRRINKWILFKS